MMLEPITAAVEAVSRNIRVHGDHLSQNEYRTRAALVDPLLQALEWNTTDPDQVQMEYSVRDGHADYALFTRTKPLMVIEAKKLGEPLPPHFNQARSYATQAEAPFFTLTNGNLWQTFHIRHTSYSAVPLPLVNANISEDSYRGAAAELLLISQPLLATHPFLVARLGRQHLPAANNQDLPDTSGPEWTTLQKFQLGQPRPTGIQLPDGVIHPVKYWKDLLIHTAEYLVRQNLLTTNSAPITAANSARTLVGNTPRYPEKKHPRESHYLAQNLYLEIELASPWCLNNSKRLLTLFEIDLTQVRVKIS